MHGCEMHYNVHIISTPTFSKELIKSQAPRKVKLQIKGESNRIGLVAGDQRWTEQNGKVLKSLELWLSYQTRMRRPSAPLSNRSRGQRRKNLKQKSRL